MDVVDARAGLGLEVRVMNGVEHHQIATGGFEGDHVSIHRVDVADDVVELGVAHVGVDLGGRLDGGVHQTEGRNGPVEVLDVPVGLAQRQLLTQGGLIDLDDLDAGGLEIEHFVADGEGELLGLLLVGDVLARPGPVEDGHRAGEHALHHVVGLGLGVRRPFHGDRVGAGHITPDDRRLDATGAVGLNPSVLGEQEAVEVLAEIFDHVVTLELAVDQHVEADLLLLLDDGVDLGLDELVVGFLGDLALAQLGALGANLLGLGEGADGGGRQQRQAEGLALQGLTLLAGRLTHVVGVGQLADALGDGRVGGHAGAVEQGLVGGEGGGDFLLVLGGVGQSGDFLELVELLDGEREVLEVFGRDAGLAFSAERHVQQGGCGGDGHVGGDLLQGVDQAEGGGVVVAPDVAAVDHAGEDGGVGGHAVLGDGFEVLFTAFVEVQADAVEAEQVDGLVHVGDVAEVGVEQHLDVALGGQDLGVQGLEELHIARLLVEHEVRLIKLDPCGTEFVELVEHFDVDGGHGVDQALVELEFGGFRGAGELQERVRADEHGLGVDAQRLGLVELVERLGGVELDLRGRLDFGHQIVVVGGEPLLHRQGGHVALVALVAAGHGEERVLLVIEGETLVTLRNHVEEDGGVQHLIVVAEVVAGNEVDAGGLLQLPVLGAQFGGGGLDGGQVVGALPVAFDDLLQFAVLPDAGKAGDGSQSGHESSNVSVRNPT